MSQVDVDIIDYL